MAKQVATIVIDRVLGLERLRDAVVHDRAGKASYTEKDLIRDAKRKGVDLDSLVARPLGEQVRSMLSRGSQKESNQAIREVGLAQGGVQAAVLPAESRIKTLSVDEHFVKARRRAAKAGVGEVTGEGFSVADYRSHWHGRPPTQKVLPTTEEIMRSSVPVIEPESRSYRERGRLIDPARVIWALFPERREENGTQAIFGELSDTASVFDPELTKRSIHSEEGGAEATGAKLLGERRDRITLLFEPEIGSPRPEAISSNGKGFLLEAPTVSSGRERL